MINFHFCLWKLTDLYQKFLENIFNIATQKKDRMYQTVKMYCLSAPSELNYWERKNFGKSDFWWWDQIMTFEPCQNKQDLNVYLFKVIWYYFVKGSKRLQMLIFNLKSLIVQTFLIKLQYLTVQKAIWPFSKMFLILNVCHIKERIWFSLH